MKSEPQTDARDRARGAWDTWTDDDRAVERASWREIAPRMGCYELTPIPHHNDDEAP